MSIMHSYKDPLMINYLCPKHLVTLTMLALQTHVCLLNKEVYGLRQASISTLPWVLFF